MKTRSLILLMIVTLFGLSQDALGDVPPGRSKQITRRLSGSPAAAAIAVWNGAKIFRVHDVKETVDALRIVETIKRPA